MIPETKRVDEPLSEDEIAEALGTFLNDAKRHLDDLREGLRYGEPIAGTIQAAALAGYGLLVGLDMYAEKYQAQRVGRLQ